MGCILFLSLLGCILAGNGVAGSSWLLGCYYVNQTLDAGSLLDGVSVRLWTGSVVECGETCVQEGFAYMGLHTPERCSCYNVTTLQTLHQQGLKQILPEYCNISCTGDGLPLPCGGHRLGHLGKDFIITPVSLYFAAGPYLTNVTLQVDADWVVVNTPFAIEAVAGLAGYRNITDEWAHTNKSGLELQVSWIVGGEEQNETVEAWGPSLKSRIPYTFSKTGNYTVEVKISNVISSISTQILVNVIHPEPRNLQLALLTEEEHRPSCTPKKCNIRPGTAAVAVFANYTTSIEASVSVGANLTFVLEYGDDGSVYEHRPSDDVPYCEERNCTSVVQDHVFWEIGVYNVTVTVSNVYNTAQEVMTVVVVNHKLSSLSMSLHEDSPRLVTPLQPVTFLLKVSTASRRDTYMELFISSTNKRVFTVQEFNTTSLTLNKPDRAVIAASYGEGCTLEVNLDHVFQSEGLYRPVITAFNNVSNITTQSSDQILVVEKLSGPRLHAASVTALNAPALYHVDFEVKSRNMSITWSILTKGMTLLHSVADMQQTWSYTFTTPGHYVVAVSASNIQGNVSTWASVYVQVPVTGLTLTQPPEFHASLGHMLSLSATIETGSDVEFFWNFSDANNLTDIVDKNHTTYANHTYFKAGKYNVSIVAQNNVSRQVVSLRELFIIQQKVTFVALQSTEPTALGNATIFLSIIDKGTDIHFDFDFGQGRGPGKGEHKTKRKYFVTHFFTSTGIHQVKVFAYNLVSEVTSQIDVIVEEPAPQFVIEVVGPVLGNRSVVLAAMKGGDVIQRPDLIYTWYVGNHRNQTVKTRSPLLFWIFPEAGLYNVSLEAGNRLEPSVFDREVSVEEDEGQLSLHHCGVAEVNQSCHFSLQGNVSGAANVTVEYQNDVSSPEERAVNPSGWNIVFKQSGLHRVFVRGQKKDDRTGKNQEFELFSFFIVEEAIGGLQLKGPQVVALHSFVVPRRYVWEAVLDQGSHVIYVWALGNNRSLPTTYREYAQRFVERGTYVLFLELFNDVSRVMANLTIVAQYSIVDVEAIAPAVVLQVATNLSLVVEGGREFFIHVDFGDSTEEFLSSEDSALLIQTLQSKDSDTVAPEHRVFIPHVYKSIGLYMISVNVSNMLSWKTVSKSARVEEPITGIAIGSNSLPVIPVGDTVEIFVTVESGTDLSFKWHFSNRPDSTSVTSNATSSVANHTFISQGTYVVSVEISNPYVKAPIVATLADPIQVVQPVLDLTLEVKNAVELVINQGQSTEDVVVTASCYDCSHVTFAFDFGDNTSQRVDGAEDNFAFMTGETTHRYTAVGVYSVSVTAITPLNKMTSKPQLLYVQVAPKDLRLDHAIYKTRFGNDTHFKASLTQGTNVTLDWKFGDDQEKLNGGLEVTHRYLNHGSFNVSVTARNRVASPEASAKVYVQYPIQGVDLSVNATLVASGETVEFTATPYPLEFANDNFFVGWYIWKLDSLSSSNPETTSNTIRHTYSYARKNKTRVTVTVTAVNFVNNATSKPLDLYVLSKVTLLQMQYSGTPLLNHTLTFTMSTYSGSELNYTWDFGDGTPLVSGYVQTINHTFTRVGEYEVVGYVENALSNATVKETIFILDTPCAPPQITILPHLPGSQEQYIIERSKEVKIELETKVSCSITHAMTYTWLLLNETTGEAVDISSIQPEVFRERTLYFPARTLNYGNYTVHLEVKMNGTIVYSKVDIKLGIVASLLTSVIRGGILREISPQDWVELNGADSRDPDFENSTDMSYQWSCYRLKHPDEGCFAENMSSVLDPTQSVLRFHGHLLSPNKSQEEFAFNLTVAKPGREPHNATQILRLLDADSPRALHIQITCPACHDGLINNNERLAMKAVCENCKAHDDLDYAWSIYKIASQDGVEADDDAGHNCEPQNIAAAAAPESLTAEDPEDIPKNVEERPAPTTTTTVGPPIAVKNSTVIPELFIPKEGSSDGRNARRRRRKRRDTDPEEPEDPIPLPQPEPGTAGSGRFLGPNRRQDYVPPVPSETGSSVMDKGQFVSTISEGREETGSTGGRSGSGFPEGVGNGRNNPGEEPPHGLPVKDTSKSSRQTTSPKLIVEQQKNVFEPEAKYLKTGRNKEVFILKPGALSQGQQYIFIVQVTKKGEPQTKGESWVLVVVNQSPSRGICTVPNSQSPAFSYELEEQFQVYCKEWQDNDHGPLSYEVSYRLSLEEEEPYNLIYRGLNTKMDFRLPAGRGPEHKVFVRILISDNFGASTRACNITLEVRPREQSYGNETVEQQLYNEVSRSDSTLGVFISQKDYSNTRVFANYLTLSLNRLAPASEATTKSTRQEVRHTLLSLLNSFPIRDEYELWQTIQPVFQLTKVIKELDKRCVDQATRLLQKIATAAQVIYRDHNHGHSDLLRYIVEVSSNIMDASSRFRVSTSEQMSTLPPRVATAKVDESVASLTWVIDTMLQGQLQSRYVGEEAVQWSSSYISVFANRYATMTGPLIQTGDASCSLPTDMSRVLPAKSQGDGIKLSQSSSLHLPATNENCYEAHMITFHENPFSLNIVGNKGHQVNSKVTSLKVMKCNGEEVKVKNLSRNNMVKIEIPQKEPEKDPSSSHTLNKWQMNVHQFNITEMNFNQSLHIQVELMPVGTGRLFSIAALIRCGEPPLPDLYLLKREFKADQNTLPLYLPAGTLNETGPCYMGLVDSRYNAGRPRPQDVRERVYTLKSWWGRCLYWDAAHHTWSGEGCHTTANSTLNSTVCLCSHMTMFASRLDVAPNDLHFTNVEDFFELYRSAVMFAWIAALLVVYVIAVLFCRRIDLHNARKGGVVYLQDNAVTDHQKYEITLETGFRKGAGTTAKISIILHGEDGMSETRELISADDRPLFERNSRDTFIMTLPDNIGRIWKVQLWHNNSGASPSWYLSRVVIRDLSCGNTYYFICEKWLAVEEDEGKVEGEFMSLEGNLGFKKVFWAKGTQYATDLHLWASVVTCPSYSRFTRVQRLTCCLTLLMSYMCLNAMWYKDRIEQYRGEFGLLDLSWRSVVVGAIITAIVLPINLFLVFLFRRSKVENHHQSKEDVYRTGKCEHLDESAEEPVQPVMTYSILDQSLLNWQSIQEWAQKQWVKRQQSEVSSSESVKTSPQIQLTKKRETLEQASSGFEDCASQDRIQPTPDRKKFNESDVSSSKGSQTSTGGRRRPFLLPSCCRYVAWTLAVIIILGCAVVTMMYGFRFGKTKSTRWLQSFYFSFMVCVFISHPFLILIVAVYTAIKYRNDPSIFDHPVKPYHTGQKPESVDSKECVYCEECDELERGVVARQRSRYLRFARPPQEKHLIEARKKIMKEKKAYAVLQDYWQFLVFFIVLATMAYGKDLSSPFYINESLKNSLVRSGSPQFTAIRTVTDWWSWAQSGLLDGLFTHVAYDRESMTPQQNSNLYVIGQVHVRQLRVNAPITCESVTHSTLLNTCHDHYNADRRDEAPYGPNDTWRHSFYQQYYNVRGSHGTYDSSGYVVKLHRNRTAAYQQIEELRMNDWLDVKTRAVVVEFTIFYAPTSIFTSVTLLLETPSTGGAFPEPSITSTYLYKYISVWDNMVLAAELFFIAMVLYTVNTVVVDMITLQQKYFTNPWSAVDVVFSLMALAYIGCYIYRVVLVSETTEHMLSTYYEEFVDISTLAHWDEILKAMVGFLLAVVTFKFLYLLRYKRTFSNLGNFYKRAYRELFVFSAMFLLFLLAYTSLGYAAFGVFSPSFRDFWVGMETMAGLLIGCYYIPEFEMHNMIGARLFIVTYLLVVTGILTCYIVAVLSYQYKIFRQGEMIAMGCSDTLKFFWERFLLWAGIKRPPPEDEPESDLPPEFTMAEIEYQVDELLFRMNAISGSSNLPEKPPCYFIDSDVTYGVGDDGISSGEGSETRPFDEERFEQRIQKIEENLYSQEPYLAQLIKLDSIGADVLSHEREKQLRSHLELEIFRRLQMQREQRLRSSDRSSSSGGSLSLPVGTSSRQASPSGGISGRKAPGLYTRHLRPIARSESSLVKPPDDLGLGTSDHPNLQTILAPNEDTTDVSRDTTHGDGGFPEHLIREALSRDFGVEFEMPRAQHKQVEKTKSDSTSGHSSSASDDWRQHRAETTTTSSEDNTHVTGAGARAKIKHGGQPKVKPEAATPSSAKVFSHSSLRDLPPIEVTKTSIIGSPGVLKRKPPPGSFSLMNPNFPKHGPSGILIESSSGSEQDAYRGKRPSSKARTLRKTKSRGKGKGGKRLPTLDSLEDDLSFEHDGYNTDTMYGTSSTSESSKDKSSSSSENKQAWL